MSIKSLYPNTCPSRSFDFANARQIPRILSANDRTTTATYFDATGTLRTANANQTRIDHRFEERTNLLINSTNEVENYWYSNQNLTMSTANSIVDPFGNAYGTGNAQTVVILTEDSVTSTHSIYRNLYITLGETATFSVFLKPVNRHYGFIYVDASGGSHIGRVHFDLHKGVITSTSAGLVDGTLEGHGIEPYPNGWYRVWITGNISSQTQLYFHVNSSNIENGNSFTGNGLDAFYMAYPQVEYGDTITDYIPTGLTTNTLTKPICYGLLQEGDRVNYMNSTEGISHHNTGYGGNHNSDQETAPDGTFTADLFYGDGTETRQSLTFDIVNIQPSTNYTFSIFVKNRPGSPTNVFSLETANYSNWSDTGNVIFDLEREKVSYSNLNADYFIEKYPNGWYRVAVVTTTNSGATSGGFYFNIFNSSGANYGPGNAAPSSAGFYLWGAQVEEGLHPTSYIPNTTTNSTTVTRYQEHGMHLDNVDTITDFYKYYNRYHSTIQCEGMTFSRGNSPYTMYRITEGSNLRGIGANFDTRRDTSSDSAHFSMRAVASGFVGFDYLTDGNLFGSSILQKDHLYKMLKTSASWNYHGSVTACHSGLNVYNISETNMGSNAILLTEDDLEIAGSKGTSGANNYFQGHVKRLKLYPSSYEKTKTNSLSRN